MDKRPYPQRETDRIIGETIRRLQDSYAAIKNKNIEPECEHDFYPAFNIYSNGTKHYVLQCIECGWSLSNGIKKKDLDLSKEVPFDPDLYEKRWLVRTRPEYQVYLGSEIWKSKRDRVFRRDNGLCQCCLINDATEVHHKTYERIGREPLFDLVSICRTCHATIHNRIEGI